MCIHNSRYILLQRGKGGEGGKTNFQCKGFYIWILDEILNMKVGYVCILAIPLVDYKKNLPKIKIGK